MVRTWKNGRTQFYGRLKENVEKSHFFVGSHREPIWTKISKINVLSALLEEANEQDRILFIGCTSRWRFVPGLSCRTGRILTY